MNKENAHLYLPFVQALADGITIEQQHYGDGKWNSFTDYNFSMPSENYRIKSEPRVFWTNIYRSGENGGNLYTDRNTAVNSSGFDAETIKLIEVIK